MHTDFSDDQIEYAGRLLNHREQLDDREVQEWLEHPENRAVLDQLARTRQELDKRDFSALKANEWKVLKNQLHLSKTRVLRLWMSVAATVVLGVGIGVWFGLQQEKNLPLAGNGNLTGKAGGLPDISRWTESGVRKGEYPAR